MSDLPKCPFCGAAAGGPHGPHFRGFVCGSRSEVMCVQPTKANLLRSAECYEREIAVAEKEGE